MSSNPTIPSDLSGPEREALADFIARRDGITRDAALELIDKAGAEAARAEIPRD